MPSAVAAARTESARPWLPRSLRQSGTIVFLPSFLMRSTVARPSTWSVGTNRKIMSLGIPSDDAVLPWDTTRTPRWFAASMIAATSLLDCGPMISFTPSPASLSKPALAAVGILPGVDDVERHVRVLQLVVETLDRDLERGPARIAQRRPGAGDRQQRADPDLRLAGLRRRRQRTECKHGRERDDRAIGQRTAEDAKNAAFYTTAPLRHTLVVAGEWPSFGGRVTPAHGLQDPANLSPGVGASCCAGAQLGHSRYSGAAACAPRSPFDRAVPHSAPVAQLH